MRGSEQDGPGATTLLGRARALIARHRALTASLFVVGLGLFVFAMLWFQPWKLFVDETVDEALPPVGVSTPGSASPTTSPDGGPTVLSSGTFRSLEHETTGTATIVRLADGSHVLRFENLRTSNGPDLVVYLSDTPATEDDWYAYDDGAFVNLGRLKGNIGSQNYRIPDSVDISRYRSAVVWCRRFTVGFGAAPIELSA